ncbi:MAG: 23S rRNA (guanosine(2251)-2'-O)-methyltransferase RlmB [Parvibaculaceae bacterium]
MPRPPQRPRSRPAPERDSETLYGLHTVRAALANPRRRLLALKATLNASGRLAPELAGAGVEAEIVLPQVLDRLTGPEAVHQGVVAEFAPLVQPRLDQIPRKGSVVLLDQVTDPHNIGAILRSCAAFAATALVMTARHSPEGSAVVAKAASGALEHVPMVKVTNLARAMEELKDYRFTVLGLDGAADTDIAEAGASSPTALVLGAEGKGLRELTRKTCDLLVRISLPGPIESLNVSNAAALALYALSRKATAVPNR